MKFYIVDVFAEEKYTGNQLAVFTNAADISENQMQRIAKEMNYSETTFVVSKDIRAGGWLRFARTRTTIRRSSYLRNCLRAATRNHHNQLRQLSWIKNWANTWRCNADGAVDWLWMQQIPPTFAQVFVAETIAQVLEPEIDSQFDSRSFYWCSIYHRSLKRNQH